MTKCQITCKFLQKSSKCQNFLRVWHLVIFGRTGKKTTVYIYLSTFYEIVRRHFIWSQSDRLSAYFYRLDTDTTQMSCNANLELVAIDSQIAHQWHFCENLDAWQKSGEAISPQETLPCSPLMRCEDVFFNLWLFPCLPPLPPWRKEGQTIWDKFWTVQFKHYSRSIPVVWRRGFYWHKCFVYDLIPFPFQPMRDLDRNSGDQSKHLLDCTSGFDCLHFENLAGVSLQALWYWNNFMMFLASSSKHLPHPDWKVNRKKNFYPVGAWILLGFSS